MRMMRVMVIMGIMTIEMIMGVMMELEGQHHIIGFAVCRKQSKLLMSINSEHARNCMKKKIMMTNKTLLAS